MAAPRGSGKNAIDRVVAEALDWPAGHERALLDAARLLTAALGDMNRAQRCARRWKALAKKLWLKREVR